MVWYSTIMTKSRVFLFLLLAFIAGIAVRSFLYVPYFLMWLGLVGSLAVSSAGILRKQKAVIVYGFFVVAFLVGIFRFDQIEQARPDLSQIYGRPFVVQGIVWEEPERSISAQRLKVRVGVLDSQETSRAFYTLITLRRYPEYKIGDELKFQGILEEPANFRDFDYISYLARDDVFSTMSFPVAERIGGGKGSKLKILLSRIKHSFEDKIDLAVSEPHAAFLKGLLLGERESLPEELAENFKRTGTTHIVALSGYNITLVGSFIIGVLLFFTAPFRFSFWIAAAAIALFVILTGAAPSVVRAGVMGILVLVARREGRIYHMTNALALAGALMIFHNPKILRFDEAFQLSFLATIGLVYLSPMVGQKIESLIFRWRVRLRGENQLDPRYESPGVKKSAIFPLKQIFTETLSAQLMVLPLLIYLFGRVSIISPITNILVLIAVPYAMAAGFATGIAGFLWEPLSQVLSWVTWVLLEYQILVIEFFAKIPAGSIELGKWVIAPLVLLYLVIWYKSWRRSRKI